MRGISFGEKHSYRDWNLMLTSKNIGMPEVQTQIIKIPGADGELDFSESLTGDIKYNNRKLEFTFFVDDSYKRWYVILSQIANYIHGKKLKIILDDDMNFYYLGRAEINKFKTNRTIGEITITCNVDPYKYDLTASNEEWQWDPFDFETGIINETKDLQVDGELEVVIYGRRKKVSPIFYCDNALQCIFEGQTYNFIAGTNLVPNIQISEGKNLLKFVGNGKVSVEYRGGSL